MPQMLFPVIVEALRLEAQEQARKAAEEEKRQQLIKVQTKQEDERLASERSHNFCLVSKQQPLELLLSVHETLMRWNLQGATG